MHPAYRYTGRAGPPAMLYAGRAGVNIIRGGSNMDNIYLTPEGYEKTRKELFKKIEKHLK